MSEFPTYNANSLNEILMHVPTDKLAVCMRDMAAGLLQAAEMRDQYQSISEAMGLPFDREAFVNAIPWTWVDDGKCIVRTTVKASHEGETVSVTREVDHLAAASEEPLVGSTAELLGELYQILGALGAKEEVLNQVLAAAEGRPLPHATLLPYDDQPTADATPVASASRDALMVDRDLLEEMQICMGGTGWRCADDLRALLDSSPRLVVDACGGCGETNEDKRCIGCLHPFALVAAEPPKCPHGDRMPGNECEAPPSPSAQLKAKASGKCVITRARLNGILADSVRAKSALKASEQRVQELLTENRQLRVHAPASGTEN